MKRCAHCGRQLKAPGKTIYPLGELGPECAHKFAALPQLLAKLNLGQLELGGMVLRLERTSEGGWKYPDSFKAMQARCKLNGLTLNVKCRTHLEQGYVVADCWLSVNIKQSKLLANACGSLEQWQDAVLQAGAA